VKSSGTARQDTQTMRPISTSTHLKGGSMTHCSGRRCGTPIAALSRRVGPA
jgi:hypothetical protein